MVRHDMIDRMEVTSITQLGEQQLEAANEAQSGRSAVRVYGRPSAGLRQTLMALAQGSTLGEHKSPGDASLLCLQGQVVLRAGTTSVEIGPGELLAIPPQRHDVQALKPSVLLLTVSLH